MLDLLFELIHLGEADRVKLDHAKGHRSFIKGGGASYCDLTVTDRISLSDPIGGERARFGNGVFSHAEAIFKLPSAAGFEKHRASGRARDLNGNG